MDPRLLHYYNRELQHLRDVGGEFSKEYPKIAGRLGLDGLECADPYVERLLEGFAFLAARVQIKIDAEFPRFTRHLLENVYPHYLAPTPSMAVVQLQPDLSEGALGDGFVVPRDTSLRSLLGKGDQTPCEYRTAHDVTLWPIELVEAEYLATTGAVAATGVTSLKEVRAGLRLRLRATAGLTFDKIALDALELYLPGSDEMPMRLYEQFLGNGVGVVVQPKRRPLAWQESVDGAHIRSIGFQDSQALLPYGSRSFSGYRLLHEYFAFPNRYLFVSLTGLSSGLQRCKDSELELIVLFDRSDAALEHVLDVSNFALHCTPSLNLFPKRCDRIHLDEQSTEYHVVADRTRPMDFEVYQVTGVTAYGTSADLEQPFLPFYASHDTNAHSDHQAYYSVYREPRALSSRQRRVGPRSSYVGSEIYVSLVDGREAPFHTELRQLGVTALCTNRDLPLHMPIGQGKTDFTMESGAPVEAVRCLAGPTRPHAPHPEGESTWRLISHLSLNYLSLVDNDADGGADALRDLLRIYSDLSDPAVRKQIEGVRSVKSRPITRRIPLPGPITFGRGLEITVSLDEADFEGSGVFLMGMVLEEFFAQYVSMNSFTETVINTPERGEIVRWPARIGRRQNL